MYSSTVFGVPGENTLAGGFISTTLCYVRALQKKHFPPGAVGEIISGLLLQNKKSLPSPPIKKERREREEGRQFACVRDSEEGRRIRIKGMRLAFYAFNPFGPELSCELMDVQAYSGHGMDGVRLPSCHSPEEEGEKKGKKSLCHIP